MRIMMIRSFEHRVSLAEIAGVVVLAMITLWFFWHRTPVSLFAGGAFTMLMVLVIDRLLHTTYAVANDTLTIKRGRFGRVKEINLSDIDRVEKVKTLFTHYVLVEYSGRKHAAISTINEDSLIKALNSRTLNSK